MAVIEKRAAQDGSISYRVKIRLRGYPSQSASFSRLTDAKRWAASTESAIKEGRHFQTSEAKKRTVSDLFARYRAEVLPRLRSEQGRNTHLDWWEKHLGAFTLADLRPARIIEARKLLFVKETRRGTVMSEATANRYLATLRHACTWAVKELQWLEDNPCLKIKTFRESSGVTRFLSPEEQESLLQAAQARSPDLYAILILALSTGARRSEILNLRWPNIDLKSGLLTFPRTKNGSVRVVPVTGAALAALRDRAAARKLLDPEGLVFPGRKRGTKDKPLEIERIFQGALQDAGIQNFTFHCLRHTAASRLVMAGVPLLTVSEILGHRSLAMTQRYSHLSRDHVQDAVSRLDNALFGGGQ